MHYVTRSAAITERPRDAPCRATFCAIENMLSIFSIYLTLTLSLEIASFHRPHTIFYSPIL